ncbi:MAG: site-specific DNA-methyltransferase [Azospirillum sp.]|nr:site-specific DNA-methyltransferase [Azospirillum sp.]
MANRLYYGDNLTVLRESIADETVDLIYLDPPFNSQANYNVLFKGQAGKSADAQIEAFEDTWHWGEESERAFSEVLASTHTQAAEMLRAMRLFLGENDMMAYLSMMSIRLIELHRVLKPTGSLYLHCDPTASHYLKVILDGIFGVDNFRNELIWRRTGSHGSSKRWGPVHDTIFFYAKTEIYGWNKIFQEYEPGYIQQKYTRIDERGLFQDVSLTGAGIRKGDSGLPWRGFDPTAKGCHWAIPATSDGDILGFNGMTSQEKLNALDSEKLIYWPKTREGDDGFPRIKKFPGDGTVAQDCITDIAAINSQAQERLGYPTQKPVALLERIVAASSNIGDVVLDPFCGCGTTVHAAQKLGRQWIGIDITHLAISLIERRLKDAFPGLAFEVHGTPKDLESAIDLARRDKYQFQWWAVSLVNARPYGGKEKGADGGIDGILFFRGMDTTEKVLVSVKGGGTVGVGMVRDLIAVIEREKAAIGVLICLALPTKPMEKEAAAAGFYQSPVGEVPRLQIITLAELFQGKRPRIPLIDSAATFKTAAREDASKQGRLI